MFRAAFRVFCMLLLATIIVDVTNTRCFKNSLTYRYSKQFGAIQYGKTVATFMEKTKDKLIEAWREKDLSKIYKDISFGFKENSRLPYQWFAYIKNNLNLLLEAIQKYMGEKPTLEYSETLSTASAAERKVNPGNILES